MTTILSEVHSLSPVTFNLEMDTSPFEAHFPPVVSCRSEVSVCHASVSSAVQPGLHICGDSTYPGIGVPSAVMGGHICHSDGRGSGAPDFWTNRWVSLYVSRRLNMLKDIRDQDHYALNCWAQPVNSINLSSQINDSISRVMH